MNAITIQDVGQHELIAVDPYRSDTNTPACIRLRVKPDERTADLDTCSPGQGIPVAEYHGRHITLDVSSGYGTVDGPAVVDYLRGEEGQALLARMCDGHTTEWDGHNHVGRMTDDAQAARETLSDWLSDAPILRGEQAGLWDAGDYLQYCDVCTEYHITAETTDSRLREIAETLEAEALAEDAVVCGIEQYLEWKRDELNDETED